MQLPLDVAVIQHNPTVGDVAGNCEQIREAYVRAVDAGADVVVTPELALLGYPPRDLLHRQAVLDAEQAALHDLRDATERGPALVVGHSARSDRQSGPPLTNNATVFDDRQTVATYDKRLPRRTISSTNTDISVPGVNRKPLSLMMCRSVSRSAKTLGTITR